MKNCFQIALAALALTGLGSAARADLTLFGEVGLPLNPTAQIPQQDGGFRVQGNYFDLGDDSKIYGVSAAGRAGDMLEINGTIARLDSDGEKETGFGIGAKYLFTRESDPAGVRLAAGVGYFDVDNFNNIRVYGVATKSFGPIVEGRQNITGHLGVRYDRFDFDSFGGKESKVSVFAGVEVPVTPTGEYQVVGEVGSKIIDDGGTPYSLSLRYRPRNQPFGASIGFQRQGLVDDSGFFVQLGYTFGG